MILKTLDDRLVPRLAAGLRRLLDRATPGRGGAPVPDESPGRSGLLGLLRDVPQLAALLAAVVFLGVAGLYLLVRSGDDRVAAPPPADRGVPTSSPSTGASDTVLGAPEGAVVDDYLAGAAARTAALAEDPDARALALVSLTDYLTPGAAEQLLQGVEVRRSYLRAPAAGELAEVFEVPTPTGLVGTLRGFYATTAAAKQEDAREFQGLADSIEQTSEQETAAKQAYVADAQRASAEAAAYGADCACLFSLVVEGPAGELAALAADPQVRGVEPADRSARLELLQVNPLQPETSGRVPPPPVQGGPTIPGEDGQ